MIGFDYGIIFMIPITLIAAACFFILGKKHGCPKPQEIKAPAALLR